jgi:hypothetical protein
MPRHGAGLGADIMSNNIIWRMSRPGGVRLRLCIRRDWLCRRRGWCGWRGRGSRGSWRLGGGCGLMGARLAGGLIGRCGLFRGLIRGLLRRLTRRCLRIGHRLDQAPGYRRLDGGRRGSDEFAHILQFRKDNLALDSELSSELVDPNL